MFEPATDGTLAARNPRRASAHVRNGREMDAKMYLEMDPQMDTLAMSGARVGPPKFGGAFHEKRSLRDADCFTLVTFLFGSPLGKPC
jgi:hypothetical protein